MYSSKGKRNWVHVCRLANCIAHTHIGRKCAVFEMVIAKRLLFFLLFRQNSSFRGKLYIVFGFYLYKARKSCFPFFPSFVIMFELLAGMLLISKFNTAQIFTTKPKMLIFRVNSPFHSVEGHSNQH